MIPSISRTRAIPLMLLMVMCLFAAHAQTVAANDNPASQPPQGICTPGPHQIALFTGTFFGGDCVTLDLGTYLSADQIGLADNSVSSVLVGGDTQVVLCTNPFLGGVCETFTVSDNDLSNNPVGSDTASSARVQTLGTGNCSAGAYQVAVFVNLFYDGQCVTLEIGDYPNTLLIGIPPNTISSIQVGAGVEAVLCRGFEFTGICETFNRNDPILSNNPIGNNNTSSIRVRYPTNYQCYPGLFQVALYTEANYGGECVKRGIGFYSNALQIGLPDNSVSSVRVGLGVRAVVCRDNNFGGVCETFTNDDPDLSNNPIGSNQASSLQVLPGSAPTP